MTNNREELLKCALELFTNRGYDGVGVQEIVDAVGIKKPTLYHYFGSKSGLLNTLLAENLTPFLNELAQAVDYHKDVTMSLRRVAETYFRFAGSHPRLYRFYLSMWFAPVDSDGFKISTVYNDQQQRLLEQLFGQAAEDHGNMRGRQRSYAATFLGMLNTYIMLGLNGYTELNEKLVQSMVHQFMHGIFS